MPVNTYKFGTCPYFCCECIKSIDDTITIKRSSIETELKKRFGMFYNKNTVSNALILLARDGHLKRESTNMSGETIYIKKEVK